MKERQRKTKKTQRQKRTRGDRSYSERVEAKWFCWAFKLGFMQVIYKVFKSNLELALPIILKQRDYVSQSMLWWSVDV